MNDTEFEEQKLRVQALSEKWLGPLGLKWWRIDFEYVRDGAEMWDPARDEIERGDSCAQARVRWEYGLATLKFNLPSVKEEDDDHLEHIFVHELMHIFLNEMREDGIIHEEHVATTLAKAFIWLRESLEVTSKP